jgi:hypothetical protein
MIRNPNGGIMKLFLKVNRMNMCSAASFFIAPSSGFTVTNAAYIDRRNQQQ